MATIVTRSGKGSSLTHAEVDANFTNLNADKLELAGGTMSGDLAFGDNDKALFGAGSDLQIYHDGSNSYIKEAGQGALVLQGTHMYLKSTADEYYLKNTADGSVEVHHNGSPKLATTSTGVDVTGTITSDGLTVSNNAAGIADAIELENFSGESSYIKAKRGLTLSADYDNNSSAAQSNITFETDGTEAMRIDSSGDISFYEDTGTTPKFFWDASAESLGIGTASPRANLSVYHPTATDDFNFLVTTFRPNIVLEDTSTNASDWQFLSDGGDLQFRYGDASTDTKLANEAMRIDDSGNVGIGTTNPATTLDVDGGSADSVIDTLTLKNDSTGTSAGTGINFVVDGNNDVTTAAIYGQRTGSAYHQGSLQFLTTDGSGGGLTERMRIDSSGRVTTPYQPLFSASDTRALNITSSVLTSANCFNSIDYNVGNHFNSSNGRFTAPVAGYYDCSLHIADASSSGKEVNIRIRKNGTSNTGPLAEGYNQSSVGGTNVFIRCIVQLNVGDYIDFEAAKLNTVSSIQHKRFIIHMLG